MEKIGTITHFFDKIGVAVIKLDKELKLGEKIKIEGKEEPFEQEVTSMQVDYKDIEKAEAGSEVGLKLKMPVRVGAAVYKVE